MVEIGIAVAACKLATIGSGEVAISNDHETFRPEKGNGYAFAYTRTNQERALGRYPMYLKRR